MKTTLIIFLFLTINCLGQKNENDLKKIDSISRNLFTKFFNKDISGFLDDYDKRYYDVGNRSFINRKEWKEKLVQFTNSEEFTKMNGLTVDKLIDKLEIYNYNEILITRPSIRRHAPKFNLEKNDYLVYIYFRPEYRHIMVEEGWFGFFRLVKGKWKIVAGD